MVSWAKVLCCVALFMCIFFECFLFGVCGGCALPESVSSYLGDCEKMYSLGC